MTTDFDFDMSAILACEPTWVTCTGCKNKVQHSPCWDCVKRQEEGSAEERAEAKMGLFPRFRWAKLGAPELAERCKPAEGVDRAAARVRSWGGLAVAFVGPAGGGKTSFAIACIRDLPGALIVTAAELGRARDEHRLGDGDARIVTRATRARVLLMDDLGQDQPTRGGVVSAIVDVVNARHNAGRPTWFTTGLTVAQIEARYGAGVKRRLTETSTGNAMVVRFGEVRQ